MKKLVLLFFLFISTMMYAQNDQASKTDTLTVPSPSSMIDSLNKAKEDEIFKQTMEQNAKNLDSFLQERKEMEAKQKRNAMIRIGIGILLLIVLVIGLRRMKAKK